VREEGCGEEQDAAPGARPLSATVDAARQRNKNKKQKTKNKTQNARARARPSNTSIGVVVMNRGLLARGGDNASRCLCTGMRAKRAWQRPGATAAAPF
jgi:hypothetical protein